MSVSPPQHPFARSCYAILLVLAVFLPACPAWSQEAYLFGAPPWQRGQTSYDVRNAYRPLLEHLSQLVGKPIFLVSPTSYEDVIQYYVDGRIHFGPIAPASYVLLLKKNPGVRRLATELSWDESRTRKQDYSLSQVITLKSRQDIHSLEDLQGKSIAFVDQYSPSGFACLVATLHKNGKDYRAFFSRYFFLGSHPRATDALAAGSVDAAATWDFNLAQAIQKYGDIFKVVWEQGMPNAPIVAHPSLPKRDQDIIASALLTIDPALLAGLPTAGYVQRPDSFYDPARELLIRLELHELQRAP